MHLTAVSTSSLLPVADPRFHALPRVERERLTLLLGLLVVVRAAVARMAALREAAAVYGHRRGFSVESLRRQLAKYEAAGCDWLVLVDQARVPTARGATTTRSAEFAQYARALMESYQRKSAPAYRELVRRWERGDRIPGYGTWREWWTATRPGQPLPVTCPGVPVGWSPRNLYRLQPSKRALALARQGFAAAAPMGPTVGRDTSTLRAMELLVVDDFRLDVLCVLRRGFELDGVAYAPGVYAVVGLLLMDVGSRKALTWCLKMQARDAAGKKLVIRREDLATLFGGVLLEHGLPADHPVTILTENATAAFTTEAQGALALQFGDKVQVSTTGLFRDSLVAGGWYETGGKPWQKGWVESHFNLMHNELAALPGQSGNRYDNAPGDLAAQVRTTERLLADASRMGGGAEEALRLPIMDFDEISRQFAEVVDRLNTRTDHRLQGFPDILEFRTHEGEDWRPESALAELDPAAALAAECRSRKQSPAERWAALRRNARHAVVPPEAVAPLLSAPREVRVDRGALTLTLRGERVVFFSADLPEAVFADGASWKAHWSERSPDLLYLYRRDNDAFVAAVPRLRRVSPLDQAGIRAVAAETKRAENRLLAEWRERHAPEAETQAADRHHNAMVMMAAEARRRDAAVEPVARVHKPSSRRLVSDSEPTAIEPNPEPAAPESSGERRRRTL